MVSKLTIQNNTLGTRCEIELRWMSHSITIEKSTLVQIMGCCRQEAITQVNNDPDICRYMTSLGHNVLTHMRCVLIFERLTLEIYAALVPAVFKIISKMINHYGMNWSTFVTNNKHENCSNIFTYIYIERDIECLLRACLIDTKTPYIDLDNLQNLGPDSILRWHLTSIRNPIVEIRRSYDRLISTMGFPILVRWHLYIESGPRAHLFQHCSPRMWTRRYSYILYIFAGVINFHAINLKMV